MGSKKRLWSSSSFPGGSDGKESACNAGDLCLISGLGISPRGGHDNTFQYSCLENSMDRGVWRATVYGVANSQIRLSNVHFLFGFLMAANPNRAL